MFLPTPDFLVLGRPWLKFSRRSTCPIRILFQQLTKDDRFIPRHLHYTTIPVHKNAHLQTPITDNKRWPTMIFSHGLGGSRNSYSYIAGSLASHGIVVVCPEHRDGSAVTSFIRLPGKQGGYFSSSTRRAVPYNRISHDVSPEVYDARDAQLRIRLWEMGLIHQAVLDIDNGVNRKNLNTSTPALTPFAGMLHVHEPGSLIFAGHSFGATTMYQLLKSTYYAASPEVAGMETPLFQPRIGSKIRQQVTEKTVTMLLDMWCLPLLSPHTTALFNLPLPLYDDKASAAGGTALLAVESEAFYKWTEHLHAKARLLSPSPAAKTVSSQSFERPSGIKLAEPNFFYVVNSAHLNQSDFGILFPWLTKRIFSAEQPERALRLNLRAQLQLFRANGVPVARTYSGDLVDGSHVDKLDAVSKSPSADQPRQKQKGEQGAGAAVVAGDGINDDKAIFDRSGSNVVDYWRWIDIIGLGDAGEAKAQKGEVKDSEGKTNKEMIEDGEKDMKGEIEPGEQSPLPIARTLSAAA